MKKILVVEDDEKTAIALGARLKASGYDPLLAYDALAGLTAAVKHGPDLVILDLSMPLGGGFSVVERMRNVATTACTPVIFMTANRQPGLLERAMEFDAVGFFEKPYDAKELILTIQDYFSQHAVA